MNSVSIPSRPAARAWAARVSTVASTVAIRRNLGRAPWGARRVPPPTMRIGRRAVDVLATGRRGLRRRRLVRPVAVLVEVRARLVLAAAIALALDADAVHDVQQPHRQAGADGQEAA